MMKEMESKDVIQNTPAPFQEDESHIMPDATWHSCCPNATSPTKSTVTQG